ncbi:urotensin II-related peptide [Myxocyprinus asiaticus]|uniref:urotensin II-related peptide n=1 Tax=Myxocyprinus asiaticus TaxID=70543 RepID=UPI0022223BD9|nr:urotensin II-related peptide [Myxocyprinus asiaticus]
MYKGDMLKVLTTVVLLSLAPIVDAAPLVSGEPDVFEEPTDGDPWRTGADIEEITAQASRIFEKLLRTRPKTTFPDGDGKTASLRDLDEITRATSRPDVRDKPLGTGINNPLKTVTIHSDGQEEIQPSTESIDGSLRMDLMTSSPDSQLQTLTERNKLFRLSKVIDSEEQGDTSTAAKQSKLDPDTGGAATQEELVKMLSVLEKLHKLMNSTLSSRITIIPRGNGNGRSPGKKNKMVLTDGTLKSTTATTVDGGGTSPKASTGQMDPKLNGKVFKNSLQSTPKKSNKRVCFWKYCSQN